MKYHYLLRLFINDEIPCDQFLNEFYSLQTFAIYQCKKWKNDLRNKAYNNIADSKQTNVYLNVKSKKFLSILIPYLS